MHPATALSFLALAASSAYAQTTEVTDEVDQLRLAPANIDRIAILSNDTDYTFNFLDPPSGITKGAGGYTVAASSTNFPAVTGNGVSMTIGFLGACSFNTPHTHPRATEINYSVNTTLRAGFLAENGARFVDIELAAGSAAVFPQGAIHFEMNPSCEPAMFVAAFNSEDPGVQQTAQRFFGLPPDIVGATLGGLGVEEIYELEALIPDNVAIATEDCLQRCNLSRPATQPTTQRQPRVKGNAYLPDVLDEIAAMSSKTNLSLTASASKHTFPTPTIIAPLTIISPLKTASPSATPVAVDDLELDNAGTAVQSAASTVSTDVDDSKDSLDVLKPLLIALVALNAVILIGMIASLVMYLRNPNRKKRVVSQREANWQGQYALPRKMLLKSDMYHDDSSSNDGSSPYSGGSFGSFPTTPESAMKKF